MSNYFTVSCSRCRRSVRVQSVSVFPRGGYSYGIRCICGMAVEVDGAPGEGIPQSFKREAEKRRIAADIAHQIDHDRRGLPASDGKARLRAARMRLPVQQPDQTWLVYHLDEHTRVFYESKSRNYVLIGPGRDHDRFQTVQELVNHLDDY
jgi:hypothetical protein